MSNPDNFAKLFADRIASIANNLETEALSGHAATTEKPPATLTIESLEATMRDIDPDGSKTAAMRLWGIASTLDKGDIGTLIKMAEYLRKMRLENKASWLP